MGAARIYVPFVDGSLDWTVFLSAHNEHRLFTERIVALSLFLLDGNVWNPLLIMQVNAVIYVAAVAFITSKLSGLFVGRLHVLIFVIAAGITIPPYSWENTLFSLSGSQNYNYLLLNAVFLWAMASCRSDTFRWWFGLVIGWLAVFTAASGAVTLAVGTLTVCVRRFWLRDSGASVWSIVILIVLTATAVAITPKVDGSELLRAHSVGQFANAFLVGASWPFSPNILAGISIHAPLLIFSGLFLLRRIPSTPETLYTLSLAAWLYVLLLLFSFGRAPIASSSRYLDVHAIGLVLNAAALLYLFSRLASDWKWRAVLLVLLWVCFVACGLVLSFDKWDKEVCLKAAQSLEQENNVRGYLLTKNPAFLLNKPHLAIPYPDAERLKSLLDSGTIQALLPPELSRESKVRQ